MGPLDRRCSVVSIMIASFSLDLLAADADG
jgi:hypothetical protein